MLTKTNVDQKQRKLPELIKIRLYYVELHIDDDKYVNRQDNCKNKKFQKIANDAHR